MASKQPVTQSLITRMSAHSNRHDPGGYAGSSQLWAVRGLPFGRLAPWLLVRLDLAERGDARAQAQQEECPIGIGATMQHALMISAASSG